MQKEIEVKICCGTNCYITGGSGLHLIKNHLPEDIIDSINIKGVLCQDVCTDMCRSQKPPIAWINNEMITQASINKLKSKILEQVNFE
ncbi:hypothetical protein [Plebeiibacterium marinum]|uniref:(2Fe-2S) ferredoxin domain-containing protein n=1 Tax=Plebeiibacterium marinum TaxID=2992111 RepID=A0AAE3SM12_9BACT|nr:hypothetical protein [Plebeiobacterium marinum]MCW3807070.1 hypothetical protein [Plebeiobacterium marinum]